jgi:hypothetical protein
VFLFSLKNSRLSYVDNFVTSLGFIGIYLACRNKHVLNFANFVSLCVAKSLGDKEMIKGLREQLCVSQWIDRCLRHPLSIW